MSFADYKRLIAYASIYRTLGLNKNLYVVGPSGCGKSTLVRSLIAAGVMAIDCDALGKRMEYGPQKGEWVVQPWRLDQIKALRRHVIFVGACHNLDEIRATGKYVFISMYVDPEEIGRLGTERDKVEQRIPSEKGVIRTAKWYAESAIRFYNLMDEWKVPKYNFEECRYICRNYSNIVGNMGL